MPWTRTPRSASGSAIRPVPIPSSSAAPSRQLREQLDDRGDGSRLEHRGDALVVDRRERARRRSPRCSRPRPRRAHRVNTIDRCNPNRRPGASTSWRTPEPSIWTPHTSPAYDEKSPTDWSDDVATLQAFGVGLASTVVDLGAGTGAFARAIAPHVARVVAVDVSRSDGGRDARAGHRGGRGPGS